MLQSRINTIKSTEVYNPAQDQPFLEIQHHGLWGRVCTGTIDIHVATVACREDVESFAYAITSYTYDSQSSYNGTSFIGSISCSGMEMNLEECQIDLTALDSCPVGHVLVQCTHGENHF